MSINGKSDVMGSGLSGSARDFRVPSGPDLLARGDGFFAWQEGRRQNGYWPFSRSTETRPGTACKARDDRGNPLEGINFSSQDYLSLASHPEISAVATDAVQRFGVHSAGSAVLVGNTASSVALERKIADFLQMEEVVLYPTGWAAGYGVIRGLVRSADHIVMDALAHTCLQEGANASTQNISLFRHLDVEHCRAKLEGIRARDTQNGIMVITEGLFSMDSDTPDLAAMQALCDEFGATLMVDVAHDLGALGAEGRGHIGIQNMLGKVDLVMGSFSKTFASNGGFVATNRREIKEYLRYYSPSTTFSNALSPVQTAVIGKAFDIVASAEGKTLREQLMRNVVSLRTQFAEVGLDVYGDPSAIVCAKVGRESIARMVSRRLPKLGLLANLVEYPAVAKGAARFRLQVMAGHSEENIRHAVKSIKLAVDEARIMAAVQESRSQTLAMAA
ncbi:aminotransferase class I/II-fold pyridoxal phosphate-dependent enzyme [Methylobacterium sp. C25]|uniref:aminotransferase class I/II-fold pyridoxal phosphate-dependent enzyme n=1 Tax=Methylobacterium sp. C25 TaxID=2721622 RepID=UPI001F337E70|nr:aminotransferase class I/II-fold pyridoxal phosphate-dependent enzyme [Methylobacterium sp. C25]MCE4226181.1 aminotransferase class I/II-fold pyridoxal phosphate-dependent enzyme [Methylobacterium sp. C25]